MAERDDRRGRRRRRAVGPPGAAEVSGPAPDLGLDPPGRDDRDPADDDRLSRDRPPHHDRGV